MNRHVIEHCLIRRIDHVQRLWQAIGPRHQTADGLPFESKRGIERRQSEKHANGSERDLAQTPTLRRLVRRQSARQHGILLL